MKNVREGAAAALFAVVTAWFVCGPAFAFGPAEHEKITRGVLSILDPATLDELTKAVVAPDDPKGSLLKEPSAHCHNGDFLSADMLPAGVVYPQTQGEAQKALEECRDWMLRSIERAVAFARPLAEPDAANTALDCPLSGRSGSAKCQVLAELGRALHTTQDFYSHTNWVDITTGPINAQNPPGLNDRKRAGFIDLSHDPLPPGLMSGCFESTPEALSCNYGLFPPRNRVKHAFLNKDTGPIGASGATGPGTTPRGKLNDNFKSAVDLAIGDTEYKYEYFKNRLKGSYGEQNAARIACVLQTDDAINCARDAEGCGKADIEREYEAVMAACGSEIAEYDRLAPGAALFDPSTVRYRSNMSCENISLEMARQHDVEAKFYTKDYGINTARARAQFALTYCIGETIMKVRRGEETR